MSLQNWEKNSWLVKHKPTAGEISQLLGLADRDLKDSRSEGLTAGSVSEGEAKEMFQLAKELRKEVEAWLGKAHPGLLSNK